MTENNRKYGVGKKLRTNNKYFKDYARTIQGVVEKVVENPTGKSHFNVVALRITKQTGEEMMKGLEGHIVLFREIDLVIDE